MDDTPELEFKPNGTVVFNLERTTLKLRRPTVGEFRKIRERMYETSDTVNDLLQRNEAATAALAESVSDDAERGRQERAANGALDEAITEAWGSCLIDTFTLMGAGQITIDEMPVWMPTGTTVNRLASHWRDNPLGSGAPSPA